MTPRKYPKRGPGRPTGTYTQGQRLVDLDRLLSGGDVHRLDDLAARYKVTERSVRRDLAALAACGMPWTHEGGVVRPRAEVAS